MFKRNDANAVPYLKRLLFVIFASLIVSDMSAVAQPLDWGAEDLENLQLACERGDAYGCADLGVLYYKGEGVTRDFERAVALFHQACQGGSARGCTDLGSMYVRGVNPNEANGFKLDKDYERAQALYKKSCDEGDPIGCLNYGSIKK